MRLTTEKKQTTKQFNIAIFTLWILTCIPTILCIFMFICLWVSELTTYSIYVLEFFDKTFWILCILDDFQMHICISVYVYVEVNCTQ